jgi:murein L,D-transpeptidase YcbB/YkuD
MKANTLLAALLAAGALSVSGAVQAQDASGGAASGSSGSMQTQSPGAGDMAAQSGSQMPGSSSSASQSESGMPGSGGSASGSMASGSGMQPDQMSEDDIRRLQQALADQGHDLEVDGIWGPNTQTALREFQERQGMDATGQLDQETLSALDIQTDGTAEADGMGGSSMPPTGTSGESSQ